VPELTRQVRVHAAWRAGRLRRDQPLRRLGWVAPAALAFTIAFAAHATRGESTPAPPSALEPAATGIAPVPPPLRRAAALPQPPRPEPRRPTRRRTRPAPAAAPTPAATPTPEPATAPEPTGAPPAAIAPAQSHEPAPVIEPAKPPAQRFDSSG
jgi:hypothetical protein